MVKIKDLSCPEEVLVESGSGQKTQFCIFFFGYFFFLEGRREKELQVKGSHLFVQRNRSLCEGKKPIICCSLSLEDYMVGDLICKASWCRSITSDYHFSILERVSKVTSNLIFIKNNNVKITWKLMLKWLLYWIKFKVNLYEVIL